MNLDSSEYSGIMLLEGRENRLSRSGGFDRKVLSELKYCNLRRSSLTVNLHSAMPMSSGRTYSHISSL